MKYFKRNGFVALVSMLSLTAYAGDSLPLSVAVSETKEFIQVSGHGIDTSNVIQQERIIHKLNFGSFTGKIEKVVTSDYSLFDEMHKEIKLSQLKGKYVVLDFWHKYCGVCYSKMPMVENLYKRYREKNDILVAGVFAYKQGEEHQEGTSILRNEGYTYSTFSTSFDSSVLKGFGIKCFPAVVVLNPDGNMIYFGDIEGAAKLVDFIFK